jgi:hypothetical protein
MLHASTLRVIVPKFVFINRSFRTKRAKTSFTFGKHSFKMNQHGRDLGGDDVALAAIPHSRRVERDSNGRVIKLDCSMNDFGTLPPQVCTLTRLQDLDLAYCAYLTELPPEIKNLKRLQTLDISNCHCLTTLPPEIGDLTNLEELFISDCEELSSLPKEIGELKKLRVLTLGECQSLTSLPPEIRNLSSLEVVILSPGINGILDFINEGGMEGWTSLRRLSLNGRDWRLGENEYLCMFRHLPSSLVDLELPYDIDSINFFTRARFPPRIRVLGFGPYSHIVNSSNESDKQSLVDLLKRNRYLGFICSDFHNTGLCSPLAEHYLDINESGRCLVEGDHHHIPLSVWSIVLERVNQKLTRREYVKDEDHKICRRANAIYYLLHGPAFADRESLG